MVSSNGWTEVRLGDLVQIKHGWPFKSKFFSEKLSGRPIIVSIGNFQYTGGFRFATTTNKEYVADYPRDYDLTPGEILLAMTCQTSGGEILGIPARVPNDGRTYLHNQRLGRAIIKAPDRVDRDFLYWLFLSKEFNRELVVTASGTKILHTAPSRIESFRFRLPPVETQRTIAQILGALDDKIELNRRMNEALDDMCQTIFKSWFVEFQPVHAKAALRRQHPKLSNAELSRRALPHLDPAIAELFPDALDDSDLGPIPHGWTVRPLDQIARFLNGLALQKYPPTGESYLPVIKIAEMRRGNTVGSDRASLNLPPDYVVRDGDVLFSWSGSLQVIVWCGGDGALNQHLFKVTSDEYPKWFFLYWIKEHLAEFQAIAAAKATTMGHIQRHHLTGALVVVPPVELLRQGGAVMQLLIDRTIFNNLESRDLAAIRDELLPRLLSGELGVTRHGGGL